MRFRIFMPNFHNFQYLRILISIKIGKIGFAIAFCALMPAMPIMPGMSVAKSVTLVAVLDRAVIRVVLWLRADGILRLVCRYRAVRSLVCLVVLTILVILIILCILSVLPRINIRIFRYIGRIYRFEFRLQRLAAS